MSELPSAVGFDPVVEAGHRSEVVHPCLSGWAAVVGGSVGDGVVDVAAAAGVGRVGEHVDGVAQVDRFAEPVGDLVGVDRGLVGEVEHRFHRNLAVAEPAAGLLDGDGTVALEPRYPARSTEALLVEVDIQGGGRSWVNRRRRRGAGRAVFAVGVGEQLERFLWLGQDADGAAAADIFARVSPRAARLSAMRSMLASNQIACAVSVRR